MAGRSAFAGIAGMAKKTTLAMSAGFAGVPVMAAPAAARAVEAVVREARPMVVGFARAGFVLDQGFASSPFEGVFSRRLR